MLSYVQEQFASLAYGLKYTGDVCFAICLQQTRYATFEPAAIFISTNISGIGKLFILLKRI